MAIPARVIATSFALIAFAAALVVGIYAGNDAMTVLWRGLAVLVGCYMIGLMVGSAAQRAIDEHTRRHEEENPVPQTVDDLPQAANLHGSSPENLPPEVSTT